MLPFLVPGDWLDVTSPKRDFLVGDVVVRGDGHEIVVHRIVKILTEEGGFVVLTKGDNSRKSDLPCSLHALIGIVRAVERDGISCSLDRPWVIFFGRWLGRISAEKEGSERRDAGQAPIADVEAVSSSQPMRYRRSIVGLLFFCIRWIHGMLIRAMFRKQK